MCAESVECMDRVLVVIPQNLLRVPVQDLIRDPGGRSKEVGSLDRQRLSLVNNSLSGIF